MKLQQQKSIVKTCLNSLIDEKQEIEQQTVTAIPPQSLVYSAKHSLSMLTGGKKKYNSSGYLNQAAKQVAVSADVTTQDEQQERSLGVEEILEVVSRKIKLLEIDIKRNKAITELTQCLYLDLKAKINRKKKGILHE